MESGHIKLFLNINELPTTKGVCLLQNANKEGQQQLEATFFLQDDIIINKIAFYQFVQTTFVSVSCRNNRLVQYYKYAHHVNARKGLGVEDFMIL